jgi:hypothetical protein
MCQSCDFGTLKNDVYHKAILDGNFSFLTQMAEPYPDTRLKLETAMRAAASVPKFAGRAKFIAMASYFLTSGVTGPQYLQVVDPISGGLAYRDPNHLNNDGARRAEQLFRKELFGQRLC